MSDTVTNTKPSKPPKPKRQRLLIGTAIALLIAASLPFLGFWVMTRPWFLSAQLVPALTDRLGADISVGSITYLGEHQIRFDDFQIRARGIDGEPGEVISIGEAILQLDLAEWWRGRWRIESIDLTDVHIRLTEFAEQAGRFSFMELNPTLPVHAHERPPSIQLRNAIIEVALYDPAQPSADRFQSQGTRRVAGTMHPIADVKHEYQFVLIEVDGDATAVPDGFNMKGTWNAATFAYNARIDGLVLDQRAKQMCPLLVRTWWDRMNLDGRLHDAIVKWDGGDSFVITFGIDEVSMKLPFRTEEEWARFHRGRIVGTSERPLMQVNEGMMRLERDEFSLQVKGKLIGGEEDDLFVVPYSVGATITQIPQFSGWSGRTEWMDLVLDTVPFTMNFEMSEFRVVQREDGTIPAVDLPLMVAEILEKFQLTDWSVWCEMRVSRAAPIVDDQTGAIIARNVDTKGQVQISEATGRYERLPYPLNNVNAHLTFENGVMELVQLHGVTDTGAAIMMKGTIEPGPTGAVDLRLGADGISVDDRLRAALGGMYRNLFDDLLHAPSYESLLESNVLPDQATLDQLASTERQLRRTLRELTADNVADEEREQNLKQAESVRDQIKRVERQQEFGVFELGGRVDLNMDIHRESGEPGNPKISGIINIRSLGLLDRRFPYPFTITRGTVRWESDRLTIDSGPNGAGGLVVLTPGGGMGMVSGQVLREQTDDGERIMPDLIIGVFADQVNDALIAAIPPSPSRREGLDDPARWPGRLIAGPAQLIRDVGLRGELNYRGAITAQEDRRARHDFEIILLDGSADPTHELAETIGAAGLLWPDGFSVQKLSGRLFVSPERIELRTLAGEHENGVVLATGMLDLKADPRTTKLRVAFEDLPLGRYLVNLVPGDGIARAHELWDRYEPDGHFDASLVYRAIGEDSQSLRLEAAPRQCSILLEDQRVTVAGEGGLIDIKQGTVAFRDLNIRMNRGEQQDGRVVLNGSYGFLEDGDLLEVEGTWTDGSIESPVISEILNLIDAEEHLERHRALQPSGRFDADFRYDSPRKNRPRDYQVLVRPASVTFLMNETAISAQFDASSTIVIEPDLVQLHDLVGRINDNAFRLNGLIALDDLMRLSFGAEYNGRVMDEQMQALVPKQIRDLLNTIKFEDGRNTRLSNVSLRLDQFRTDPSAEPQWRTAFKGNIRTNQASLDPGIKLSEFDGDVSLEVLHMPGEPLRLNMDVQGHRLRALGRELTSMTTERITLDADGRMLLIRDLHADSYHGAVWAEATIGIDPDERYEFRVDLVGLSLRDLLADDPNNYERISESSDRENANANANAQRRTLPSGKLYGSMKLSGIHGEPASRSGRGVLRAIGGNLEAVPILLQIIQIAQLTFPLRGNFDGADVNFYIDGDRVVFERILFESTLGEIAALQLLGSGEMDYNTFHLNTIFRSRSSLLLVRELAGGLGDQLYNIEITGPLRNPQARLVPLPGIFRGLLGGNATAPVNGDPSRR